MVLAFVAWGVLFTDNIATVTGAILTYVMTNFGWVFILSTLSFLIFMLYLAFSRYGSIRLGKDDEKPEFRTVSWIAMMFSAGMGIGLMFFGVAEPMYHFGAPPHGLAKANTPAAAETAMQFTYFHWAFHPWAIYAVVALTIAYFTFRKGSPNLVSSAFRPILGDRVERWPGKTLDILAIFATLFGSCTSLGLGALQMNSGLNFIWGVPQTTTIAIIIIVVVTALFIVSAVSGVERGIQWLSNGNMVMAVFLLLFVLFMGPTLYILNTFVSSIGNYLFNLIPMSFTTAANGDEAFLSSWTIFYWVWWASWGPFVGTFIARISRGTDDPGVHLRGAPGPEPRQLPVVCRLRGSGHEPRPVRGREHRRGCRRKPGGGVVRHPGRVPAGFGYFVRGDLAGRHLLHQRGGRGFCGDGHALSEGYPASKGLHRRHVGRPHRRRGGCRPPVRRTQWSADGGDHSGSAFRARHNRHGLLALQVAA